MIKLYNKYRLIDTKSIKKRFSQLTEICVTALN
jgi:hypothetical protein